MIATLNAYDIALFSAVTLFALWLLYVGRNGR
jgi:hypothetical protein